MRVTTNEARNSDSSRFWRVDSCVVGHAPPGYDKHRLRDWAHASSH
jgi:phosphoribosylaminoimidazole-succinocarboxamide synthase